MGLRAFGETIQLNELKGDLIALKYLGADVNVETTYGLATAARASVVKFETVDGKLTARQLGSTLVFQRAIQNEIRGSSDWSVGVFEQLPRPTEEVPDATMYQLTTPEESIEDIGAAMEAAGISLD
jgi:hypothetical protein